jgi:hypothetical protein
MCVSENFECDPNSIKPEAQKWVYWTMVSTDTLELLGATESFQPFRFPSTPQNRLDVIPCEANLRCGIPGNTISAEFDPEPMPDC